MINGASITLADSYFKVQGVPLHTGMFSLVLLFPFIKLNKIDLGILIFLLTYSLLWIFDFTRFLLLTQSYLFILFLMVFSSLEKNHIYKIIKYGISCLGIFAALQIISSFVSSGGSVLAFRQDISNFFELPIYQVFLTYPAVLIFSLFLVKNRLTESRKIYYWVFLAMVILLEILFMRKVALVFLFLYLLTYHWKVALFFSVFLFFVLSFLGIDFSLLIPIIDRIELLLNPDAQHGGFQRMGTYKNSINLLSDPFNLILGNGINNYSHNYFLHTMTTHGIFYSLILFSILFYYLSKLMIYKGRVKLWFFPLSLYLLIDMSLNANLYQSYYAMVLAMLLVFLNFRASDNIDIESEGNQKYKKPTANHKMILSDA